MNLPTAADEDWRYVDCRGLAEAAASAFTVLPGESCTVDAFPAPADATHAWAIAPGTARRWRASNEAIIHDAGGCWALFLDVPAGTAARLRIHRSQADGRSASWIHAVLGHGANLIVEDLSGSPLGVHLAAFSATVAQDAALRYLGVQHGGRLQRHHLAVQLSGLGASVDLAVAADPRGENQAHVLTRVVHEVGPTTSRQLIKSVLRDRARVSFDGVVTMLKGADGSSAEQRDQNLVLSPLARADTRPQLDIRADEVEASHGATIGALDAEELLYLRTRGLSETMARELLTTAFLDEVLGATSSSSSSRTSTTSRSSSLPGNA
jgi:Fe-S cluster assembly scaffold protein SufB